MLHLHCGTILQTQSQFGFPLHACKADLQVAFGFGTQLQVFGFHIKPQAQVAHTLHSHWHVFGLKTWFGLLHTLDWHFPSFWQMVIGAMQTHFPQQSKLVGQLDGILTH